MNRTSAGTIADPLLKDDGPRPARIGKGTIDPGSVVVRFARSVDAAAMRTTLRAAGADSVETNVALAAAVAFVEDQNRVKLLSALEEDPRVQSIENNRLRYISSDPNDAYYDNQFHLLSSRFPLAWELTKGSPNLDIAILDTGVDLDHPDLAGRIGPGYDVVNNDSVAEDDAGHGTMVAGVAAARTDNGIGVAGAAWNARIMPVKVIGADGSGTDFAIGQGIVWAVERGAEVINLSLGGPGSSALLEDAVDFATAHSVLVVAAAGNEGSSEPSYPAAIPAVLAVGATDLMGEAMYWTNHGSWVDLTAPGKGIFSTARGANYSLGDGTSFSAPIVAGVALLIKSKNPSWTPAQIASRLTSSSADRGPRGIDDAYGFGYLDAYAAVGGRRAGSPPAPAGDAHEPNDVPDRATPLSSTIQATIAPEGDADWFYMDVTDAGTLEVQVDAPYTSGAFGFDPVVEGYLPDLSPIGKSDKTYLGSDETFRARIRDPGRYYFRVTNYLPSKSLLYSVSATLLPEVPVFSPYEAHDTGSYPESVDIADVTGDGRNDVLMTTRAYFDPVNDYKLFVFPQLPDGTLGTPLKYATNGDSGSSYNVSTGDLDGDGDIDVAVANPAGIDLYHQNEGVLNGPTQVAAGTDARFVSVGDVNGDGSVDLVVAVGSNTSSEFKTIVMERADGTWAQTSADLATVHAPMIGDISGDGRADIVGLRGPNSHSNIVRTLVQQQDGTFAQTDTIGTAGHEDVEIADFNGDGLNDVVGTVIGNSIDLFAQNELGALDAPIRISSYKSPQTIAAADLNGDGLDDLVVAHGGQYRMGVYLQEADGTLSSETLFGLPYATRYDDEGVAVGDISGDGQPDVAIADYNSGLLVVRQGEAPTPAPWVRSTGPADRASGVTTDVQPMVTLVHDLDAPSLNTTTTKLLDGVTGSVVPAARTYDAETRTITLKPYSLLKAGHPYIVEMRGLRNTDGITLKETVRSRFTTAAGEHTPTSADVNGDGYDDVIIGAPDEDVRTKKNAGAMHVLYGSATGAVSSGSQVWSQDTAGIADTAESGDRFGASIATGDVNGDGYDDVAIGVPGENLGPITDAGLVHVILGSASGLRANASQSWTQNSSGVADAAEASDKFGASLAFGDFDASAGGDLAIGSPGEKVGTAANAGAVHILSGRSAGLTSTGSQLLTQTSLYGADVPSANFGGALAAGDFDGDTHADLAIGAPTQDVTNTDQGTITLMRGSVLGLRLAGALWSQLLTGNEASAGERFGSALAIGDFDSSCRGVPCVKPAGVDGFADLAIGAPGAENGAGRVHVLYSDWIGAGAAHASAMQVGNGNASEAGDSFGAALAAGRVKGSPSAWLAIGVPGEDIGSATDAGAVHVVSPTDWLWTTPILPPPLTQDSPNTPGVAESGDRFGAALRVLDVDKDGAPDVVAGSPNETFGSNTAAGATYVMRRAQPGGALIGQYLYQGKDGVRDKLEVGDHFGSALGG